MTKTEQPAAAEERANVLAFLDEAATEESYLGRHATAKVLMLAHNAIERGDHNGEGK